MESNKLIAGILTATVVIILAASALVPVIDDAAASTDTYSNVKDSLYKMTELTDETEYTFTWDHTNPTKATINGDEVDLKLSTTVISNAGSFLIRYGQDAKGYYLQSVPGSTINIIVYSGGPNDVADLSITIAAGTCTAIKTPLSGSPSTVTTSITSGFAVSATGDWVLKSSAQRAYVLGDSRIYAMGLTTIANVWYNGFYITGSVDDIDVTMYTPVPATYTISDVAVVSELVDDHESLYIFDAITFKATQIADTSIVKDCVYNYVVVPAEVTAERSTHATPGQAALYKAIPVLVFVALLVGVIGYGIYRSRN